MAIILAYILYIYASCISLHLMAARSPCTLAVFEPIHYSHSYKHKIRLTTPGYTDTVNHMWPRNEWSNSKEYWYIDHLKFWESAKKPETNRTKTIRAYNFWATQHIKFCDPFFLPNERGGVSPSWRVFCWWDHVPSKSIMLKWNLSITTTEWDPSLPFGDHLGGP